MQEVCHLIFIDVEWPGLNGVNHHFSVAKGSLAARLGIKDLEVGSAWNVGVTGQRLMVLLRDGSNVCCTQDLLVGTSNHEVDVQHVFTIHI